MNQKGSLTSWNDAKGFGFITPRKWGRASVFALLIVSAVGGAVSVLYLKGYVPLLLPVAYGVMSLFTFVMYAVDKGAAESGNRRVPEGRLHLFEFLCGWPGALVGQQFFRHKTRKTSFQVAFWFNVILNLAVLGWLLVWQDAEFARQALGITPVMLIRI